MLFVGCVQLILFVKNISHNTALTKLTETDEMCNCWKFQHAICYKKLGDAISGTCIFSPTFGLTYTFGLTFCLTGTFGLTCTFSLTFALTCTFDPTFGCLLTCFNDCTIDCN